MEMAPQTGRLECARHGINEEVHEPVWQDLRRFEASHSFKAQHASHREAKDWIVERKEGQQARCPEETYLENVLKRCERGERGEASEWLRLPKRCVGDLVLGEPHRT